jgi:hypothetical protein
MPVPEAATFTSVESPPPLITTFPEKEDAEDGANFT